MNTVKIDGIQLIIDGNDFRISIDEARELWSELDKLFDNPKLHRGTDPLSPLNPPFEVTCGTVAFAPEIPRSTTRS